MPRIFEQLITGEEAWFLAIELLVIWACVFVVFRFLQGTRGAGVIKGFAVLLVVATLVFRVFAEASDAFGRLNFIFNRFLGAVAILLIVVFQPELRQAMIRLGHAMTFRSMRGARSTVVDAVDRAAALLSQNRFGALIAIERAGRLGGLIDSGIELDAIVSAPILESIFWPNNPLHDLGVVIRDDRIVAASVQFPLAEEGALAVRFGSRHRAAVGLSLESDCVIVVVSEETGAVSIAEYGRLIHDIPRSDFRRELARRLDAPQPPPEAQDAKDQPEPTDESDEKQAA